MVEKKPINDNFFEGFSELLSIFSEGNHASLLDTKGMDTDQIYEHIKEFVLSKKDQSGLPFKTAEALVELENEMGDLVKNLFIACQYIVTIQDSSDPLIKDKMIYFDLTLKEMLKGDYDDIEEIWENFKGGGVLFSRFVTDAMNILGNRFFNVVLYFIAQIN